MTYLLKGLAVVIAIVFHEMAHGYASHLLGDPTPESSGRLSLNPLNHLDPIGTLCLFFFGFSCFSWPVYEFCNCLSMYISIKFYACGFIS